MSRPDKGAEPSAGHGSPPSEAAPAGGGEGGRADLRVGLGRVSGLFGVRGWVKVHSYTEPRENIVGFGSWILERDGEERRVTLEAGERRGKQVVAKVHGIDDRDQARELIGAEVLVERSALPPCDAGEYYWVDLEGLEVRDMAGELLGRVDCLMATGANDVIVLGGPGRRMIPFVAGVVKRVDIPGGVIVVDWDAAYWEA